MTPQFEVISMTTTCVVCMCEEERERLRGERDKIKIIELRFLDLREGRF